MDGDIGIQRMIQYQIWVQLQNQKPLNLQKLQRKVNVNLIYYFVLVFIHVSYWIKKNYSLIHNADDDQYIWKSQSAQKDSRGDKRGVTQITIHLKQDARVFAEESTIKELIKKYSEFINFPIQLKVTREVSKQVKDEPEQGDNDADKQIVYKILNYTNKKATKTKKEKVSE